MLRGKILAGPTSNENQFGKIWTLGAEFRFFNHHSIGADWVSFHNEYQHESLSAAGYYENDGTFNVKERTYLLIDYRYYITRLLSPIMPYFNVLTKIGHHNEWYDDGQSSGKNIPYKYSAEFNEYGLAVGSHFGFNNTRMGFDVSLGAIRSYRSVKYGNPYVQHYDWKFHMRVNFYFNLFKIRPKK